MLQDLQLHFINIGRLVLRWPASEPLSAWFIENQGEVHTTLNLMKEIEGKNIACRIGTKAQRDFACAWALKARVTGTALQEAVGKVRLSAAAGGTSSGNNDEDDDVFPSVQSKRALKKARFEEQKKKKAAAAASGSGARPARKCVKGVGGKPGCGKMHVGDWSTHVCS